MSNPSHLRFIPLDYVRPPEHEIRARVREFLQTMRQRRSVRHFSSDPVPMEILIDLISIAAQAPSGANRQPWRFVLVTDPEVKKKIRQAAEEEEKRTYEQRMPGEFRDAVEPLGTDWHKEFLEIAPALIVVFRKDWEVLPDGRHLKAYYVSESVGVACGFLVAAIHQAGLVCLTHTPSPMKFLSTILGRPPEEKPFLLIPVGFPAPGCEIPDISRKPLSEILEVV
ncbi:MAG: nitroreductase family protein [Acidobacteriota bacterium]